MSIALTKAAAQLDRLGARTEAGEDVVITKRGRPVATLVPVALPPVRRVFGALRGEVTVPASLFDLLPEDEPTAWG